MKMVSASGGFRGLPISRLVNMLAGAIAASMLEVETANRMVGDHFTQADSDFIRNTLLLNLSAYLYHSSAIVAHYICVASENLKCDRLEPHERHKREPVDHS
jgi:hypothetical protein